MTTSRSRLGPQFERKSRSVGGPSIANIGGSTAAQRRERSTTMTCSVINRDQNTAEFDNAGCLIRSAVSECWLGAILVATTDRGICAILLGDDPAVLRRDLEERFPQAGIIDEDPALDPIMAEVVAFMAMPVQGLDLPLDPRGTTLQQRVWRALREIPAGSTASYGEIAERIGAPKEAYAVGEACAANVIAVAIPCHRVVRKNGGLAGYRWGFRRKRALLERERAS
jgi:AraC family transcriptional regulator, regulatory protein of adaptative response / methylated-DNA-[protein]-cysteine methyltransferase